MKDSLSEKNKKNIRFIEGIKVIPTKFWVFLLLSVLFFIYLFSLANYLMQPPTKGFSRESFISSVEYGAIKNLKTAVVSVTDNIGETTIAAIDGHRTRLIRLDTKGNIKFERTIDLDLFSAKDLTLDIDSESNVSLFYIQNGLFQATIHVENGKFSLNQLATDVLSYGFKSDMLLIEKKDELLAKLILRQDNYDTTVLETRDFEEAAEGFISLLKEPFTSYAVDMNNKELKILYTLSDGTLNLLETKAPDFSINTSKILIFDCEKKYIQLLEDMKFDDEQLIGLFSYVDKQYGVNTLTTLRYELADLKLLELNQQELSIQKGRVEINAFDADSILLIVQDVARYGVNIVRVRFQSKESNRIDPLTITRKYSVESNYSIVNGIERLIFSDRPAEHRDIFYASNQPDLISENSALKHINLFQLIVTYILVVGMSILPSLATYLLKTTLLPMFVLVVMVKIIPTFKHKSYFLLSGVIVMQYLLTLNISLEIMSHWSRLQLMPLGIRDPLLIYLILGVFSVLSGLISLSYVKKHEAYENNPIYGFMVYLFSAYFSYILLVVVYIYTELIVGKI